MVKRIIDLPEDNSPDPGDYVAIDNSSPDSTRRTRLQDIATIGNFLVPADISVTVQAYSVNLDEVATVDPGTTGKTVLAASTAEAVRILLNLDKAVRGFAGSADLVLATVPEDVIMVADVPLRADASGTFLDITGKKFRPFLFLTPRLYGALGYSGVADAGVGDSRTAIMNAWAAASVWEIPCDMEGLNYNCSEQLTYVSNLKVTGYGATVYPTAWPATGGFITNVHPSDPLLRVVSNIVFEGLTASGELLPTPTSGENCNLFDGARGVYKAVFRDCIGKKMRDGTGGGTGGGAFGMEQGAHDVLYINCIAEDCYRGARVSGHSGVFADAAAESRGLTNNRFINFTTRRCGQAIIAHAAGDTTSWNSTDLSRFDATFDGVNVEDCGHYPWREFDFAANPGISAQKTGIFVFFGAQGVRIINVRVKISSGYTASTDWLGRAGYPASGNYIGAGLSGNVGALVRGWGRDCLVEFVTLDGTLDAYWMFDRAVCAGDIGTTVPTGVATQLRGQDIIGLRHVTGSVAAMFDCPAGITDANFRCRIEGVVVNAAPTAILGTNAVGLNNVMIGLGNRDGSVISGRGKEMVDRVVNLSTFQQDKHYAGGLSIGGGYGSVGVRDGWTNDGQIWRTSAATTSATTKMAFYNPNGLVGQIQTNLTATAYVTSSDETWKDFIGAYDPLKAIDIIKRDPVRDFHWKQDRGGTYAVGWGAQTSHKVSEDLASPGGWLNPLTNERCKKGDTWEVDTDNDGEIEVVSAIYVPWGIDQSKRTPYLWAAVSWLIERNEEMKAEIEALKAE